MGEESNLIRVSNSKIKLLATKKCHAKSGRNVTVKYQLTAEGKQFAISPMRDTNGRISSSYFKKLILLFAIEQQVYKPSEFKEYVESLNILVGKDWEYMPTRQYAEWKHNVDSAKAQLLNANLLIPSNGSFVLNDEKFSGILNQVSGLIVLPPATSTIEELEYPAEKVNTTITRRIRDTILSNSVKRRRGYECQICGTKLQAGNTWYAEAHHLKPLGLEGPDIESNMIVLCPNCHVLFDYGTIAIHPEKANTIIDANGEVIGSLKQPLPHKDYIQFHYAKIFQGKTAMKF